MPLPSHSIHLDSFLANAKEISRGCEPNEPLSFCNALYYEKKRKTTKISFRLPVALDQQLKPVLCHLYVPTRPAVRILVTRRRKASRPETHRRRACWSKAQAR